MCQSPASELPGIYIVNNIKGKLAICARGLRGKGVLTSTIDVTIDVMQTLIDVEIPKSRLGYFC